jgi:hypothetical protein
MPFGLIGQSLLTMTEDGSSNLPLSTIKNKIMNLLHAIAAMQDGRKVKLPEWGGYWHIPEDKRPQNPVKAEELMGLVHVFTKAGDTLEKPWFDKYQGRDDFEVTEGNLGYDFAILALKNGKTVTRKGWGGKSIYVRMQVPDAHSKMSRPYFYITVMPMQSLQFGEELYHEVNRMPYAPNQTDMLAEDWVLYTGPHAAPDDGK